MMNPMVNRFHGALLCQPMCLEVGAFLPFLVFLGPARCLAAGQFICLPQALLVGEGEASPVLCEWDE